MEKNNDYSLIDSIMNRIEFEDDMLIFSFYNGYMQMRPNTERVDGDVKIYGTVFEDSNITITSANEKATYKITDFALEFNKSKETIKIVDEIYNDGNVVLSGVLYDGANEQSCRLEINYNDEIVFDAIKMPEWKVYFDGSFWGHEGRDRAGQEIKVNKKFLWGDEEWMIPSIYSCSKGLVVETIVKIPREKIQEFVDKYKLDEDSEYRQYDREKQEQIDRDNPMDVTIWPKLIVNGKELQPSQGCGVNWNPIMSDFNGLESKNFMWHYDLDTNCGWIISRTSFVWKTKRKPEIKSVEIIMRINLTHIPGPHFVANKIGDTFTFTHPLTKVEHTLEVKNIEKQIADFSYFPDKNMELPTNFTAMSYTLTPELTNDKFYISDYIPSDQPRKRKINRLEPEAHDDACIGIIGGADGPTSIFVTAKNKKITHTATSSVHFDMNYDIDYRITFLEKVKEDMTVKIL